MPKYYCDYCDTYLTHDSPSVRKTHCSGRKHKENVRDYYQKWLEDQVQKLVDDTTAAFKAGPHKGKGAAIPPPNQAPAPPRAPTSAPMPRPPMGMGGPMPLMGPPGPHMPPMMGMRGPPMGPMGPMGPMMAGHMMGPRPLMGGPRMGGPPKN